LRAKEGKDEIGSDTPSLGVNWGTATARVVYGCETTLAQVLVGKSMGRRRGSPTAMAPGKARALTGNDHGPALTPGSLYGESRAGT